MLLGTPTPIWPTYTWHGHSHTQSFLCFHPQPRPLCRVATIRIKSQNSMLSGAPTRQPCRWGAPAPCRGSPPCAGRVGGAAGSGSLRYDLSVCAAGCCIAKYWVLLGAASLDVACSGFALRELPLPGHVCAALYLGSTWLPGPVLAACGLAQPSLGAPPIRHAHPTPAVPWPLLRSLGMPQMGSYAFAPRNSHQNKLGTSTTSKSIRIKGFGGGTMGSMLTVQWVACSQYNG